MKKWWWVGVVVLLIVGVAIWNQYRKEKGQKWGGVSSEDVLVKGGYGNPPVQNNLIVKFAVMADVHNDIESLRRAYEQAKNDGVEMIVIAGDLTINGTKNEEDKIKLEINSWDIDNYLVPGNHDTYKNVWLWQEKYQSVRKGDLKILLIDNSNWRGLGTEQKKWLEADLPECKVIKCVAIMHMPLLNNFSKHVMGEYSEVTMAEAGWLKNILMENNVTTGYSGHLHYSSSYTVDGWETVLVGAISKERNTQTPRYTEVTVEGENIINQVRLLE